MNVGGGGRDNRTACLPVAALLVLLSCGIAAAAEVSDDSAGIVGTADEAGLRKGKEVREPLSRADLLLLGGRSGGHGAEIGV